MRCLIVVGVSAYGIKAQQAIIQSLPYILEANPHPNLIHTQFLAIS